MQQNEHLLGLIAWLQEHYVTVFFGDIVNIPRTLRARKNPEKYLSGSRQFFFENRERVKAVYNLLSDKKSKNSIWLQLSIVRKDVE